MGGCVGVGVGEGALLHIQFMWLITLRTTASVSPEIARRDSSAE